MLADETEIIYKFLESFKETTINHFNKIDEKFDGVTRRQDITNGRIAKAEVKSDNLSTEVDYVKKSMMTKNECKISHLEDDVEWYHTAWGYIKKAGWIIFASFISFMFGVFVMMATGNYTPIS